MRPRLSALLVAATFLGCSGSRPAEWTAPPPFVVPVDSRATVGVVATCGQSFPRAGSGGDSWVLPGVPDGLGLKVAGGKATLLVNHEFPKDAGAPSGPLASGARISELSLEAGGGRLSVTAGRDLVEAVFVGEPPVPAPPGVRCGKFCSSFLAGPAVGFDTWIYLTGEEVTGRDSFDGKGGLAWAAVDRSLYALPRIGHAQWENLVILPATGNRTVLIAFEDAIATGDGLTSQLYMYVGEKRPGETDALARNGLRNGALYVFVPGDAASADEGKFRVKNAPLRGAWVPVDTSGDDGALDRSAVAAGAFGFVRIEDGAADPTVPGAFYFATSGRPRSVNERGRLWRANIDPMDPLAGATLTLVLDGSEGVVSPDNIDVNRHGEIAICEDPNFNLQRDLGMNRDSSIWIYERDTGALTRIAQVDRAPATKWAQSTEPGLRVNPAEDIPGGWETSGIVDAESILGRGAWILDVQAHSLYPLGPVVLQGGQILTLTWRK